jgi:predicted dehydrogenase
MPDPLNIGLIGCGSMGMSLGKALLELPSARLVGLADPDEAALGKAAEALGAPAVSGAEELVAAPGVEAVVIAVPGFQHRPITELAAAHGKAIFVEKPMATTATDCDAMIAAAERAGVLLMVGHVLRYYPCWWKILQLTRQGQVGEPLGITVTRIGGGFSGEWARSWRHHRAFSGGTLMEVNAHEIDFMTQVCGDVRHVYAEADHYGDDPSDYPNLCFVSLRFASGAVGMLHSSSCSALGDLSGKIEGSEGTLLYRDGFEKKGEIRIRRRGGEPEFMTIGDIEKEPPVRHELRLFIEAAQQGLPSPIPGNEGRRNVAIAEAAYESARIGRPVDIR